LRKVSSCNHRSLPIEESLNQNFCSLMKKRWLGITLLEVDKATSISDLSVHTKQEGHQTQIFTYLNPSKKSLPAIFYFPISGDNRWVLTDTFPGDGAGMRFVPVLKTVFKVKPSSRRSSRRVGRKVMESRIGHYSSDVSARRGKLMT
jgi:hypothetical protein